MRDIPNYEGLYAATEDGRIWSIKRKKFLSPWLIGRGYQAVRLCKNGCKKNFLVHRLIAETFLENPNELPQVNHIDQNKTNNCLSNLEYCDNKYNNIYSHGKKIQCVETGEIFDSITEAAEAINRSPSGICACLNGEQNVCADYHWKECL